MELKDFPTKELEKELRKRRLAEAKKKQARIEEIQILQNRLKELKSIKD